MELLHFRRRFARRDRRLRLDDPIDTAGTGLLGCKVEPKLLLHDAGKEAPHRMRLPTSRTRNRGNRGTARAWSMLRIWSCLVFPLLKADTRPAFRFDFPLGAFAGFERELGFGLDLDIRTSKVGDTMSRTTPAGSGPEASTHASCRPQQRSIWIRSPAEREQSCCSLAAMSAPG